MSLAGLIIAKLVGTFALILGLLSRELWLVRRSLRADMERADLERDKAGITPSAASGTEASPARPASRTGPATGSHA